MKSTILGLVLVLALSTTAGDHLNATVATGEIQGCVLDHITSQPLVYANVILAGTQMGAMTLADGSFVITGVPAGTYTVRAMMMGYKNVEHKDVVVTAGKKTEVSFRMEVTIVAQTQTIVLRGERPLVEITESRVIANDPQLQAMPVDDVLEAVGLKAGVVKTGDNMRVRGGRSHEVQVQIDGITRLQSSVGAAPVSMRVPPQDAWRYRAPQDREQYEHQDENDFVDVMANPMSTFSIDVDAASYANARRFIRAGTVPPAAAVRIEEFVNYFDYDYPQPGGDQPFAIVTEVAQCPWNEGNRLVHIGLQGKRIERRDLPPSNLVFLIDVSGSMEPANKLPLIRQALPMLVAQLGRRDRVAIVVYAGSAGLVLDSTPGSDKRAILDAIASLEAGGSTAGGEGIVLAYATARSHFIRGGNNRVILATDGDFNVGVTSDGELVTLIEQERASGVFLTVLGVGDGNLQDAKMEKIADHGNGNYAYLDDLAEAQKVLVNELGGTIVSIAKDVKIQVEFNPARVKEYRLIGYENRVLEREDFADDRKDAGELGAGHSVTALYEVVPADGGTNSDTLRYSHRQVNPDAGGRVEMLTVALRHKAPDGEVSKLIERVAVDEGATFEGSSENFRFAAAVAEFAMLLRDSAHRGRAGLDHVARTAKDASGDDREGYRAEFVELVEQCRTLRPELATDD